jgi:hypothetical protein
MDIQDEKQEEDVTAQMLAGKNLWEVYNVMTSYLTHTMKNRGVNKLINHRKRSYELTQLFYNHDWK